MSTFVASYRISTDSGLGFDAEREAEPATPRRSRAMTPCVIRTASFVSRCPLEKGMNPRDR